MKFGAVIVGGGKGERLGAATPKCLVKVEGIPLMLIAAYPFNQISEITAISLVVPQGSEDEVRSAVEYYGLNTICCVVAGGERRQDSVRNGIKALPSEIDRVLIHDGARPLITEALIRKVIDALKKDPAVTAALPISDTIHKNSDGYAADGPDRSHLWGAQTPQGFQRTLLTEAYKRGEHDQIHFTDEVSLVRKTMGTNAHLVLGDPGNVKITNPEDLPFWLGHLKERAKLVNGF